MRQNFLRKLTWPLSSSLQSKMTSSCHLHSQRRQTNQSSHKIKRKWHPLSPLHSFNQSLLCLHSRQILEVEVSLVWPKRMEMVAGQTLAVLQNQSLLAHQNPISHRFSQLSALLVQHSSPSISSFKQLHSQFNRAAHQLRTPSMIYSTSLAHQANQLSQLPWLLMKIMTMMDSQTLIVFQLQPLRPPSQKLRQI